MPLIVNANEHPSPVATAGFGEDGGVIGAYCAVSPLMASSDVKPAADCLASSVDRLSCVGLARDTCCDCCTGLGRSDATLLLKPEMVDRDNITPPKPLTAGYLPDTPTFVRPTSSVRSEDCPPSLKDAIVQLTAAVSSPVMDCADFGSRVATDKVSVTMSGVDDVGPAVFPEMEASSSQSLHFLRSLRNRSPVASEPVSRYSPASKHDSRARGRERKEEVTNLNNDPMAVFCRHQAPAHSSTNRSQILTTGDLIDVASAPSVAVTGAIFPGLPLSFDRRAYRYDYNLPDRGLGCSLFGALPPGIPPPTAGIMGFFPGIGSLPMHAWDLAGQATVSPLSPDTGSPVKPLDLSASNKQHIGKCPEHCEALPAEDPRASASLYADAEDFTAPAKCKIEPEGGWLKENSSASPDVGVFPPDVKRPKYEKNMLLFVDREVEIISVAKNRWIVRNEHELVDLVSRNSQLASSPSTILPMRNPCDSASSLDLESGRVPVSGSGRSSACSVQSRTGCRVSDCDSSSMQKDLSSSSSSVVLSICSQQRCEQCHCVDKLSAITGSSCSSSTQPILTAHEEDCTSTASLCISSPPFIRLNSDDCSIDCRQDQTTGDLSSSGCGCPVMQQMLQTSQ